VARAGFVVIYKPVQTSDEEAAGRRTVAHELNNLLTAIIGYAAIMADDAMLPPSGREGAAEILKAAERAAALVRQLKR
jgi:signal transduction histidine kinase